MLRHYKEIILLEILVLLQFWWWNPYLAFLLTMVITPMVLFVLVVSLISDALEASHIEKEYYRLMLGLAIVPLLLLFLVWMAGGNPAQYI